MNYEKWRHRLARANDPLMIPITHVDELLSEGLAQFWATPDAAIVTLLKSWPGGAVTVEVVAAAGKKCDITGPLHTAAAAWAKEHGATHVMVAGRKGWQRELPEYRHYQTLLIKEL
jgi:hypothetical protein